ncbi:hypothetical protein CASFOL_011108 [Castilleja foliolosa]|uniref:Secreted protein n=1 Tax=Castilleja foliolosa TaxID=1961234 RepID=A0ABD3DUJ6_9LAMI
MSSTILLMIMLITAVRMELASWRRRWFRILGGGGGGGGGGGDSVLIKGKQIKRSVINSFLA